MNSDYQQHIPSGMLMKAIQNEQDSIVYHEHLQAMTLDQEIITLDQENTNTLSSILQDEKKHLALFVNLYIELFEENPDLHGGVYTQIVSFIDGLKHAIAIKLHSYDFYKNIYYYDPNINVRNAFLTAMLDEHNNYAKLNYIYEKLLESSPV